MNKVFFSASVDSIPETIGNYLSIIKEITQSGGKVRLNWVEEWLQRYKMRDIKKLSKEKLSRLTDHNKFLNQVL